MSASTTTNTTTTTTTFSLDTTKCNLVGFDWKFPCGIATIKDGTVIDGHVVDGDKLKRGKVQWFPKDALGKFQQIKGRVKRQLKELGFSYLGSFVVHDNELARAEALVAAGNKDLNDLIVKTIDNFDKICNEWWSLPENAEFAALMKANAASESSFSSSFKIKAMPTIQFGSNDQEALSKSLSDALYEDVAKQARNCLRGLMDKNGQAKKKIVTIISQRKLLETLRKLSAHAPELAVATDTFSKILKALPVNNLEAHHISTLVLWNGVLADTYKLKEHIENIDTCDMSQFGLSMTYSPKASSKPNQPKLQVNPQGFLDL